MFLSLFPVACDVPKTLMNIIIKRWPWGCLIFLLGCQSSASYKDFKPTTADSLRFEKKTADAFRSIKELAKLVRPGDIITRTGNDFTSYGLRTLNRRDNTYSHCGIASIENDSLFVYHALGGEFNPDQKLLRQTFTEFAEPFSNNGIGIFRFKENNAEEFAREANRLFLLEVPFDMDFDMRTDDRLYCAEFVVKALEKASGNLRFNRSYINKFEFAGVDDIFLHPGCSRVGSVVYK